MLAASRRPKVHADINLDQSKHRYGKLTSLLSNETTVSNKIIGSVIVSVQRQAGDQSKNRLGSIVTGDWRPPNKEIFLEIVSDSTLC